MTQQNAALVEEAAAAAQSLQDQAGELSRVVSIFKLDAETEYALTSAKPVVTQTAVAVVPKAQVKRPAAGRPSAPPAPKKVVAATAGSDEWEEF
jgi:methyl-accepting chemotaxis protein